MFRAILFDLDNTLIDFMAFKKETAKAAAKAMVKQGLPASEVEAYAKIFTVYEQKGIEHQKTFFEVVEQYGELEANKAEKIQQAGILAYLQKKFEVLKPYPAVKSTLKKLREKGVKLAIVSDAPRNKAWQRLILTGLENEFEVIITHDDTKQFKPHPNPFQLALAKLELLAPACLFVGDNPTRDVKGAKAVGMNTCLAKYGGWQQDENKADYEISKIEELLEIA